MLLMLASLATHAQDVYEYATVSMSYATGNKLSVSFSNGDYKEVEYNKDEAKPAYLNTTPALKYIAQLNKEGWELITTSTPTGDPGWRFLLKRKVKQ